VFARFVYAGTRGLGAHLALGFVAGLGMWVNQLIGTTVAVMLLVLWWRRPQGWRPAILALAFVVGALPLLASLARHPTVMPATLVRKFFLMNRVKGPERFAEDRVLHGTWQRVAALAYGPANLGTVLGTAPPSRARAPMWRLLAGAPLLLLLLSAAHALRRARRSGWHGPDGLLLLLLGGVVAVGYHSARYMLVAFPLAALLAGAWWAGAGSHGRRLAAVLIGVAFATNAAGLVDRATATAEPSSRTIQLVETLRDLGCTHGYSAGPLYHVVFATREEIVLAPLQKNRVPAYDDLVAAAPAPCYVYRADQTEKRQHRQFVAGLAAAGVSYATAESPPYVVLHGFAPRGRLTTDLIQTARERVSGEDESDE
jgi:hypothetical protein